MTDHIGYTDEKINACCNELHAVVAGGVHSDAPITKRVQRADSLSNALKELLWARGGWQGLTDSHERPRNPMERVPNHYGNSCLRIHVEEADIDHFVLSDVGGATLWRAIAVMRYLKLYVDLTAPADPHVLMAQVIELAIDRLMRESRDLLRVSITA